MAIPTITSDYTVLTNMESATGLSAWGSNALTKWGLSSDLKIQNQYSYALAPASTGDSGLGYTTAANINLSTNRLYIWVNVTSPAFVGLSSGTPAGVYIRICTSSTSWTTDYLDFYVGGSDIAWVGAGWHLIALDCNRTADRTNGTTTRSTIRRVGVGFNIQATASKSDVIAIDSMFYGTKVEVTGVTTGSASLTYNENSPSDDTITRTTGSFVTDGFEAGDTIRVSGTTNNNGEYTIKTVVALTITLESTDDLTQEGPVSSYVDGGITFESIYQKDGPTDDNWYGIVSKDRNGNYEINGNLLVGDESGSSRTFFISRGESVILADQPLSTSTAELGIKTYEDTGNTIFVLGDSTGTGDNRVGFGGSNFRQDTTYVSTLTDGAALGEIDLAVAIDTCEVFGSKFEKINNGLLFANDSTHYVTNCTFSDCGQVDLYATEARNLEFSNYSGGASTGALLWRNAVTDCENSTFLANTRAIEHTASGTVDYTNLTFYANTYDIDFSGTGTLTINNLGMSNANTYVISGSGTAVNIYTTKSISIHCQDSFGTAIESCQVWVSRSTDDEYTSHASGNAQGDLDFVVQETIQPDTPATGKIRVLQDTGKEQIYRYASWSISTFIFPTKVSGDADGSSGSSTILTDTDGAFLSKDIERGDTIRNETDGSWAIVVSVDSNTQITTTALQGGTGNTWDDQDTYSVHSLAVAYDGNDKAYNPLINDWTDSSGDVEITNYNYQASPEPITIVARKNDENDLPAYEENKQVGSISGDFSLTMIMSEDPNFGL